MDELTRRIIVRLQADPGSLSRNRNFSTFEDPVAWRARRVARYLANLAADIVGQRCDGPVEVSTMGTARRRVVRLHFPSLAGSRTAYLSAAEFELLLTRPGLREALALHGAA